jgi:hypothetical protein
LEANVQESQSIARKPSRVSSVFHAALIVMGAVSLSWPAIYNHFPLMYWDSVSYLANGRKVAQALFLHRFSPSYGVRSVFYGLAMFPLHWGRAPWMVVAMQCLLVAWVLWLVVRSIAPSRKVMGYISLMLLVSLLTSAAWEAAFIMPDILAPVLCLAIFLLSYAGNTLSRVERIALSLVAWFSITAHGSHLLLAVGLCFLLAVTTAIGQGIDGQLWRARDFKALGQVVAIFMVAVASQLAVYSLLYGKPSLNGPHPPFMLARVTSDGPGLWYLKEHCPQMHWAICDDMSSISAVPDTLLFARTASWKSSTEGARQRMDTEEMPIVLAILRAYPRQEFDHAASNFADQLKQFSLRGFVLNADMVELLNASAPQLTSGYLASRQARNALPLYRFSRLQWLVEIAALAIIAGLVPFFLRRLSRRMAGLSLLIAATIIGNAFITGVLSEPLDRYQCRVIWLVPLLAGLLLLDCFARWKGEQKADGRSEAI